MFSGMLVNEYAILAVENEMVISVSVIVDGKV